MPNKEKRRGILLFLFPTLLLVLLSGVLVWYNMAHAPEKYPIGLTTTISPPLLNPYPELENVTISINQATPAELEQLPGIGPTRAADIVAYIETHGPLASLDQLTEIKGIGYATLEKIKPYLVL